MFSANGAAFVAFVTIMAALIAWRQDLPLSEIFSVSYEK
jgi:hypothetical protein